MPDPVRICFVCSGNICRSPTAEVVLKRLVGDAGLTDAISIRSAGTGSWHVGEDMDRRSRQLLTDEGYDVPRHVARQFGADDFAAEDLVVALDSEHLAALNELAGRTGDPATARNKIRLLREFDRDASGDDLDVPDPYYGGPRGFRVVLDQIERSCAGLLDELTRQMQSVQQTESPPR